MESSTVPEWQADPIGSGPSATVYSGLDDGEPVAFKVFPASADRQTLAGFEREQAKLAATGESSILLAQCVDQLPDGRHVVRSELCPLSLTTLVERVGALSCPDVVVLGHAVASALAAAHSAGVIHGGVKPANVLFRASGEPLLADFGVTLRQAFPSDIEGSLDGLAPETLRSCTLDERTDLYGLGALLHLALTGQAPLPSRLGERLGDRLLRLLSTPVPAISLPGVPVALSTLVARLLASDPVHRPVSAAAVAEQLAATIEPGPDLPASTMDCVEESVVDVDGQVEPLYAFESSYAPWPAVAAVPKPKRLHRTVLLGGTVAAAVTGLVVAVLLGSEPDVLPAGAAAPQLPGAASTEPPSAAAPARLELAPPTDFGTRVALSWSGSQAMEYAVVVAAEGEPNHVVAVRRDRTLNVPVDPARKYCFQIQGTDGRQVVESLPRAVRGAVCHS